MGCIILKIDVNFSSDNGPKIRAMISWNSVKWRKVKSNISVEAHTFCPCPIIHMSNRTISVSSPETLQQRPRVPGPQGHSAWWRGCRPLHSGKLKGTMPTFDWNIFRYVIGVMSACFPTVHCDQDDWVTDGAGHFPQRPRSLSRYICFWVVQFFLRIIN